MHKMALLAAVCAALAGAATVASPQAQAAAPNPMTISCGGEPVEVLVAGYSLHVVGTTTNFVMTSFSVFNETLGGNHVFFELHGFDVNPIQQTTCTWTATASNGSTSTFTAVGFFTPAST
jgi:hypothetical protein